MFSKKRLISLLLCVGSILTLVIFRNALLRMGVNIALAYFVPELSLQYQTVSCDFQSLVMKGVRIEHPGCEVDIQEGVVTGIFSLQPQVILVDPLITVHKTETPSNVNTLLGFLAVKLDVPQGRLVCEEEELFFRYKSEEGTLLLGFDPDFEKDLILSVAFQNKEEKLEVDFCLYERECANIVQLASSYYPELRYGWEHLEGQIKATGQAFFNDSFDFQRVHIEMGMEGLVLVNPSLKIDATAQHFHGELTFPVKQPQEEKYSPFWERAMASLSLNDSHFYWEEWGLFAKAAELNLDPDADPDVTFQGAFFLGDKEYPLELIGKGSLHEDRSFWLELSGLVNQGEEIFLSVCSQEKDHYIVQGDVKNITFLGGLFFEPLVSWGISHGNVSGRGIGWIRANQLEKVQIDQFLIGDLAFDKGGAKKVFGEGVFEYQASHWEPISFQIDMEQGKYEGYQGDIHLSYKDRAFVDSWVKGFVDSMPLDLHFQGPFSAVKGEAVLSCKACDLFSELEIDLPLQMRAAFQYTPQKWQAEGTLDCGVSGTFTLQGTELTKQGVEGWIQLPQLPEAILKRYSLKGFLACEGHFNDQELQIRVQGKELSYLDQYYAGSIENGALCYDRHSNQWAGAIPFFNARFMQFNQVQGTFYFDEKQKQAEITNGNLTQEGWGLSNLCCHLDYDHASLVIRQGRAQVHWLEQTYPLLMDHIVLQGNQINYDISLFDHASELVRLSGEGDLHRKSFVAKEGTHFFGMRPHLMELALNSDQSIARFEVRLPLEGQKTEKVLNLFGYPHEALNSFNPEAHLYYTQGKTLFSFEDPAFNLKGEKEGEDWTITEFKWNDFALKGKCRLDKTGIQVDSFIIEHPKGQGEGNLTISFAPLEMTGSSSLKIVTSFGDLITQKAAPFHYSEQSGFKINYAEWACPSKEVAFITHQFEYAPQKNEGKVEKIDFTVSHPLMPHSPFSGKGSLLFGNDTFAFEGEMASVTVPIQGHEVTLNQIVFSLDPAIVNVRAETTFLNKPFYLTLGIDCSEKSRALLKVQETYEAAGLTLLFQENECESIQGSLAGLDLNLVKQKSHFTGEAKFNFHHLGWLLPLEYQRFKLGQGFHAIGDFLVEGDQFFRGRITGKNFEALGYHLEDLDARVELSKNRVKVSDLHIGDPAGEFSIKQLKCLEAGSWIFEAPLVQIRDFQPSRLRSTEGKKSEYKPFMISHFSLMDLQGELTDPSTFVGVGTLNFVQKEKKENRYFDIPLDILKQLGLDINALTPIIGEVDCQLKGEKLYFKDLKNSTSEGGRSQFFLSQEEPSYLTLTGDLHIDLKMRQNVVLKLIEPLTLKIRGTIDQPKYQLIP